MEEVKGWWEEAVGVSCRLIRQQKGSRSAAMRPLLGKAPHGTTDARAETGNAELSALLLPALPSKHNNPVCRVIKTAPCTQPVLSCAAG